MDDELLHGYAGVALAAAGHGDVDTAISTVLTLPDEAPGRAGLAVALLAAIVRDGKVDLNRMRWLDELVAAADADPPRSASWPALRAGAAAMAVMFAAAQGRMHDPREAMAEVEKLAAEAGPGSPAAMLLDSARQGLGFMTAMREGDESSVQQLPEQIAQLREQAMTSLPQALPTADVLAALGDLMAANQSGADVLEPLRRVRAAAEGLAADDPLRGMVLEALASIGPLAGLPPEDLDGLHPADGTGGLHDPAIRLTQEAMLLLGGWEESDPAKIEQAVAKLREAVALTRPDDPQRPFHLSGLALTLLRRSEVTNSIAGLPEARDLLLEARELAGGAHHVQWAWINQIYSAVEQRLTGTGAVHQDAVMDALRGYIYQVMVQRDLAGATVAAREASREAASAARWALQAGDPAGAIAALDMGRGLALFSATEVGTIGRRLRDAGHTGLAGRWDAAVASGQPDQLPTALRREALAALTRDGESALLDPPELGEIQAALRALDADALVYLVPAPDDMPAIPGYAVIAPAAGPPSYMHLTGLRTADHDVERYLAASARRDIDVIDEEPAPDITFTGSLDKLCDWAWRAAIGPLIEKYLPRLGAPAGGRPPRLVLVPMGNLGLIPWQAARRADGRYAVELAAISYTASARMLCHAAAQNAVPLAPTGLVVGDPGTGGGVRSLPAARAEAYAIRRSFYPGARYVGRRADGSPSATGPGSAAEVTGWLTNTGPAAGAMLHLACHGFMATEGVPTAYVLLAGGDRLTAESLGPLMARTPQRQIGLVVLAACHTGQAINGYDEAYSLGTAFLAAGVRSVLSTQWSVPDSDTSVLMYMFHHFLMTRRRPVWAALRDAQLWMLDPHRQVPDRMPAELRHQLRTANPAAVVSWAGFLHWGR
ncbi:CHAT domain-containing protein [Actinoplanes sp. NPDC026670]|uniref:CHAT domain-containing protein n=1 Tax=Actinoplanes sp. NPDC026670 TaxID=3154700 RepID=UPI003403DE19